MLLDFWGNKWSEQDWIECKGTIKDGVKREVGVDGIEVEEPAERYNEVEKHVESYNERCLRFTHGSASCFLFQNEVQGVSISFL